MSSELINEKSIDMRSLSWGRHPVGLVPRCILNSAVGEQLLPGWLIADAGLPPGSRVAALGPSFWARTEHASSRIEHFVKFFIGSQLDGLRSLIWFDRSWPAGLRMDSIPFGTRSFNRLKECGYFKNPTMVTGATIGSLLDIPGLGIKSLLEITTMIEAVTDMHDRISANLAQGVNAPNDHISDTLIATLRNSLEFEWIEHINDQDPRFASALGRGRGTLEEQIDRCLGDPNVAVADVHRLAQAVSEISNIVAGIESASLEASLMDLLTGLLASKDQRRLHAIALRFGWTGLPPQTLQECGDTLNITRERIRQIEFKVVGRIPKQPVYLPKLTRALALLEAQTPVDLEDAAHRLFESGISANPFSAVSILETARMLGHETTLKIKEVRGIRVVASGSSADGLRDIAYAARKLAGQAGMASVFQVVDTVNSIGKIRAQPLLLTEENVRRLLTKISSCEFLNEDWFWFTDIPSGRNRFCNITNRILSIVSPQIVSSIREGVRRAFRFRSLTVPRYKSLTVPPAAVMEAFFQRHPDYRINAQEVSSIKQLQYKQLLGETEQTIVDVFRSSAASLLDRKTLIEACVNRGINESTLQLYTTYSPIVEHAGPDIWKLRGVVADPAAIQALKEQNDHRYRYRETRLLDYGWTPEGQLWVAWKIPKLMSSLILGIPGGVRRYLTGRAFDAFAKESGRSCLQVTINDQGSSYGYGSFLRYIGADAGDVLLVEFNLGKNVAQLSVANDDLLNET